MSSVKQLTKQVVNFSDARNWGQYHSPKDLALGMLIEASEFAELVHYFSGEKLERHIEKNKEHLGDELADVLSWVLLAAHDLEIDLDAAFVRKLQKNGVKYPVGLKKPVGKPFTK